MWLSQVPSPCGGISSEIDFDHTHLGLVRLRDQQACVPSKAELNIFRGMAQCEGSNHEGSNRGQGGKAEDDNP